MTLSAQALVRMHPGRKRLDRPRSPDGRSNGERPADVVAVAKAYRIKNGAKPENVMDMRYGSTLGQLHMEGSIDGRQFNDAERYLVCVISNAKLYGIPSPHPRALDLASPFKGLSCMPESDTDEINRIKGLFRDCRRVLLDAGQTEGKGSEINRIVYGVVVQDWPMGMVRDYECGHLRLGLNALARVFK